MFIRSFSLGLFKFILHAGQFSSYRVIEEWLCLIVLFGVIGCGGGGGGGFHWLMCFLQNPVGPALNLHLCLLDMFTPMHCDPQLGRAGLCSTGVPRESILYMSRMRTFMEMS